MRPSSLLALPVALGLSTAPAQNPPGREPITAVTVEDKVAALDALVGELITISQETNAPADIAWTGLLAARNRINAELRRRTTLAEQDAARSFTLTEQWVEAVSQLADPTRRQQALDEIAAALVSGQEERQIAACQALNQTGQVKFEKLGFRDPVLALAQDSTGKLRVSALFALDSVGRQPEDLALVLPLVDDVSPAVAEWGTYLLFTYSDGDLTGEAGEAALRILERLEDRDRRQAMGGLWGARVSPAIEELVLALHRSNEREVSYNALYFGFSTFANKSPAVVERLAEAAFDLDGNVYQRALWGLGHGVPPEHGPVVAEAMQRLFEARSSAHLQTEALQLVGQYGTSDFLPWLLQIAGNAGQPDSVREAARQAEASIRAR